MKLRGKIKVESASKDVSSWIPKTEMGRKVKNGEINSIDKILEEGRKILEPEIIDYFLKDLKAEIIELRSTQKMTDSGRKQRYRAIVVIGDGKSYIGVGVGKGDEVRPSIEDALKDAKLSIIKTSLGCGSWECKCGEQHSIPAKSVGKYSGVRVILKPAPKGTGVVANPVIKKILMMAGVKDVWTKAFGRVENRLNAAYATLEALKNLHKVRLE
jgi:small subunit ribosomal protein S5